VLIWSGISLWKRRNSSFWCVKIRQNFVWRKGGKILLGVFLGVKCFVWLVDTVEEMLKSSGVEDFAKSYREVEKVLMVCGGGFCRRWSERYHLASRGS